MDKKKMIGAIVGVIAFIALVAGATYAWLTNSLAVTNGTYNVASKNFLINFTKGTQISSLPILSSATTDTAASLNVKAGLATGSTPGTITIYLNVSEIDTNLKNDSINFTYCKGTTCSGTDFATHTQTIGSSSGNKIAIVTDDPVTSTTQTTYNIYFWLDGSKIGDNQLGKSFTGYISAEAHQTE